MTPEKREAYRRVAELIGNAKNELIRAQLACTDELPQSLLRKIDAITGRAEALQNQVHKAGAK